jgi:hypothetical protein
MAEVTVPAGYEHDHANLRKAYADFALRARNPKADGNETTGLIFKNGVVQGKKVTLPYVDLNDTINDGKVTNVDENYTFSNPSAVLTGDIRITDTINGKDMDMMAYKFDYNTTGNDALIYLEGEKANIADIFLNYNSLDYNDSMLESVINNISSKEVYLTYGDAEVNNMYALLTNPFKRVYVQAKLDAGDGALDGKINNTTYNGAYYSDASIDDDGVINYGSTSLVAQIYDESENAMSAGQFSPATTPTIKLQNEVASTGYDVNDKNTLAYFLKQAQDQGYKRGFVILSNADSNNKVPGIMTQMLATKAGNKVVTNWIVPQGN